MELANSMPTRIAKNMSTLIELMQRKEIREFLFEPRSQGSMHGS